MGNVQAAFRATEIAFHVGGYEKSDFSLLYVEGAFALKNTEIAERYRQLGRYLMVVDEAIYGLYRQQIQTYFKHYQIDLTVFLVRIKETEKTLRTFGRIVDAFADLGLVRKEPVLVNAPLSAGVQA